MPGIRKMRADGSRKSRDSIRNIWGKRIPYEGEWQERVDEHLEQEPDTWVQSTCVLCSTGCALDIGVKDGKIVGVRGRAVDRVNRGRLGPKGLNGWMANNSLDRLTHPLIRRGEARPDLDIFIDYSTRIGFQDRDGNPLIKWKI